MHGIFSNWETLLALKYILAKTKPYRKPFIYKSMRRDAVEHTEESSQFSRYEPE